MQEIKNTIKNSKVIIYIYIAILYPLYFLLDLVLPKKKKIIFSSFSGRQYSDSPKIIYENLKKDSRFEGYKLVWAFNEPNLFFEVENKVNINSFKFFIDLFSSEAWISNSSIEKLIPYNSKKIFYLNTWHGIPLKKIGKDEEGVSLLVKNWYEKVRFDMLTTCSNYDEKIFNKVFPSTAEKNHVRCGLPRNNELVVQKNKKSNLRKEFCEKYDLSEKTRIILYAPTFREFESKNLNKILSGEIKPIGESVLLVRTHYFEEVNISANNIVNVSNENLNELMLISDCLITDYSSVMFDYYILGKPIYLYAYDYEQYKDIRGFYVDLQREYNIPIVSEKDLNIIFEKEIPSLMINNKIKNEILIQDVNLKKCIDNLYNGMNIF